MSPSPSPDLALGLPAARYQAHRPAIEAAVAAVFAGGRFILGPQVAAFEAEFAAALGLPHCAAVANGTDAVELALRACGIGPGAAVLTVPFTATGTVAAIERAGARPVWVDIDPVTFTLDPASLEATIAAYQASGEPARQHPLRAVVPVHLYGQPADLPSILAVAARHGLAVIEDCAQAHGAALQGRPVGTWGDAAAFSFYPTKNLGAFGDGGAVALPDPGRDRLVRQLREYGWVERHVSVQPGANSRLDELQAAILRVLLPHLPAENAARTAAARVYDSRLQDTGLVLPVTRPGAVHAFHQYAVRSPARDPLQRALAGHGIPTQVLYPVPLHRQPAYAGRCFSDPNGLPHSEAAARQVLCLPMSPHLPPSDLEAVAAALHAALASIP
ncbi:MAG: hypothetical protein RJA22_352 [Verrucomicrobiota bacterium]